MASLRARDPGGHPRGLEGGCDCGGDRSRGGDSLVARRDRSLVAPARRGSVDRVGRSLGIHGELADRADRSARSIGGSRDFIGEIRRIHRVVPIHRRFPSGARPPNLERDFDPDHLIGRLTRGSRNFVISLAHSRLPVRDFLTGLRYERQESATSPNRGDFARLTRKQ